jgi:lipopolysaccharide/colanic/teichoic acid biosynthesis glycosyltransferase
MIRLLDFSLSLITIIFLLPLFLLIMIILYFSGESKIWYFQERIGQDYKHFKLIKFATMKENSPSLGTGSLTIKNDPRILPFGRFLRKTKINELPQLMNVLKGEMSLVGPRPLTDEAFFRYPKDSQKTISQIKPGLSGLGSILFRNEEELLNENVDPIKFYVDVIAPEKAKVEIWFSKNNTLKNYLKIIIATLVIVIFPKVNILKIFFKELPNIDLDHN